MIVQAFNQFLLSRLDIRKPGKERRAYGGYDYN